MSRLTAYAAENGWPEALVRSASSVLRRLRDRSLARRLRAPNFRCGRQPRLLGLAHVRMGRNFSAGDHLWLEAVTHFAGQTFAPELVLGDDINVSDRVHIAAIQSVSIGAGTLIGSNVLITDHAHGVYAGEAQSSPETLPVARPLSSAGPVRIGRNVWIGDNVCVLAGADVGDGVVLGAGSIVTGTIPPGTIAFGAPARPRRRWNGTLGRWVPFEEEGR